ncbi:MAG: tetratricopeptide repeat protein, partial [Hymenobacteraceae bacterium]|nr:tetratricopeptide repeat protein [Hymenobacteraceae bacterium]
MKNNTVWGYLLVLTVVVFSFGGLQVQAQTTADAWFKQGNARSQAGNFPAAIEAYSKALAMQPTHAGAYYNRGTVRSNVKEYVDAVADFSKAI